MFVRPDGWDRGIGAQMLTVLVAETAGFARYRLSTHHSLYCHAGFRDVPGPPHYPGIVEGVDIYREMDPVRGTKEESCLA